MAKQKILFIGVGFHEYDKHIIENLKKKYDVWYLLSSGFKNKHPYFYYITKKIPILFPDFNEKNISKFIEKTKDINFDIIFVIKGSGLTDKHLSNLKRYHLKAKYKLYVWDEWEYMSNRDVLEQYFSDIYSFDSEDCKKYGFKLRPLFYINKNRVDDKIYDISFVGNDHSSRFQTILDIKNCCIANCLKYRFVITMTKSSFLKIKTKYKEEDYRDIAHKGPIPYKEYEDITRKSKTVIDIPRGTQSGLTIRTLEALASGTKVITTNNHICEYENIPKGMYYIWDYTINEALLNFIREPIPTDELNDYFSIDVFLEDILK
jgi:hypothetical protein